MGSYISAAQQNICSIAEALVAFEKCDVRFGLVGYRDHPPQCHTFVTIKFDFTSSPSTMRRNVDMLTTGSGGDGPESLCCGLHDTLHMDWRKESTKVVILITDAPPHGLGERADGFPAGCPDKRDPIAIARKMAERGICLYTVGCEPSISKYYSFATDFMVAIANITGGQAVTLSSSHQLVDVILGGTQEEIVLERLMSEFERERKAAVVEVNAARLARGQRAAIMDRADEEYGMYQQEIDAAVHARMTKRGVETKQLQHDARIQTSDASKLATVANLVEWRATNPVYTRRPSQDHLFSPSGATYGASGLGVGSMHAHRFASPGGAASGARGFGGSSTHAHPAASSGATYGASGRGVSNAQAHRLFSAGAASSPATFGVRTASITSEQVRRMGEKSMSRGPSMS